MATKYTKVHQKIDTTASKVTCDDGVLLVECFNAIGQLVAEVSFDSFLVLRVSDEGVRLALLDDLGPLRGFILSAQDSSLIQWVSMEGKETRDLKHAGHFIVFAGEEVVDVVSVSMPQVTIHDV
ncbi:MAG: hypothetical protein B7X31_13250 [Thiomonas sp. 13-66-29]|jgi:hypothetical protein|nr:MAG: hypothetical protein B7X31_13250 [Thiomonas sp. 13-66-29]